MSAAILSGGAGESARSRVLFVHAHPDDESIVTGGTIATLVDAGAGVTVVTCTRGEKGEVIPPELAHLEGDEDALAACREGEIAQAMAVLGVADHRFLGNPDARIVDGEPRRYRDSGMVWGAQGPEPLDAVATDSLCAASIGEVAADIATVIAVTGAHTVISYDENGGYGHPDHVATHRAARRAAEVMGVPFFAITPDGSTRVDTDGVYSRKIAALECYRTQLAVEGDELRMPGGQVEAISRVEAFERLDAPGAAAPASPPGWRELGTGSRIAACVVAVALGGVLAMLGTVAHQVTIAAFGADLPIGLALSLVTVVLLLAGFRLAFDTRVLAACASAALLAVISVLSAESAGGSVLIDASPLAYWWVYAPVAIAFVVLAWPKVAGLRRVAAGGDPPRPGQRERVRLESRIESKGNTVP